MDAPSRRQNGDRLFDELTGMPGHLLRRCQQIAVSIFLKECRAFDLTPLQFAVLGALAQSAPVDQVRLAGAAALDRTTVGVVLKKLEERGLVTRRVSETDRRAKLIDITDAGRALLDAVMPSVRAVQDRMLSPLTASERRTMTALLRKMADSNNEESRAPLKGI